MEPTFPTRITSDRDSGLLGARAVAARPAIRGGIGIFYDVLKGEDNLQFNGAPPFYSELPYVHFPLYSDQRALERPAAGYPTGTALL